MPEGLRPAVGTQNERFRIICVQNAAEQAELHKQMLITSWKDKTPEQAHDFLAKPDVQVTNQSDKTRQLPKIASLGSTVKQAFDAVAQGHRQTVELCDETVQRRKASLAAWEAENEATAGPRNPQRRAVVEWEQQAAAAREAKQKHETAIAHGLMPMVMEREEGRRLVEESQKAEAEARRVEAEAQAAKERARRAEAQAKAAAKEAKAQAKGAAREMRVSHFQGPCKDCCTPLAACCCVSADGEAVWGCVPASDSYGYVLPACLHLCLCPQQGCGDPTLKSDEPVKAFFEAFLVVNLFANLCFGCFQYETLLPAILAS